MQAEIRLDKPDSTVRCPISNEPLRLKQLIPIKFTLADEGASSADLVGMDAKERYICPLTKKPLTKTTHLHPAAFVRDATFHCYHQFAMTRAVENGVYLLSVNYAGASFGDSIAVGPWIGPVPELAEELSPRTRCSTTTAAVATPSAPARFATTNARSFSRFA